MQYPTIKHHWYCVTAKTDCTITSPSGLNVSLSAGTQSFVYADADSLEIAGEATLTQTPGRFSPAPAAAPGGGGNTTPVPELLLPGSTLRHGRIYTALADGAPLDFSSLTVAPAPCTAEIWLQCVDSVPVTWPQEWLWLQGSAPDMDPDCMYAIVIRRDICTILVHVAYSYSIPRLP